MGTAKEEHIIHLDGKPIRFLLKRGSIRRINIRVSLEGEVKVSAPFSVSIRRIKEFLSKKEQWILRHLRRGETFTLPEPVESVLFRGIPLRVRPMNGGSLKKTIACIEKNELHLISPEEDQRGMLIEIEDFLRGEASSYLPVRIGEWSQITGIPFSRLSIRNQRTRWGSSSSLGNININWRIIMAPELVIDYLLIHELVHQVHHNHSKDFYTEVEKYIPDYRECNGWLRDHALLLSMYRSPPL